MGEILTNYHNIEVPTGADPYQLVDDIRKMGVSIGEALNTAGGATIIPDPDVDGAYLIGD